MVRIDKDFKIQTICQVGITNKMSGLICFYNQPWKNRIYFSTYRRLYRGTEKNGRFLIFNALSEKRDLFFDKLYTIRTQ